MWYRAAVPREPHGKSIFGSEIVNGEYCDEEKLDLKELSHVVMSQLLPLYKMILAYLFGDYKSAVRQSRLCAGIEDIKSGHVAFTYASLFHALSAIALYRETGTKRRHAIRITRYHTRRLKARALLIPSICSGKLFLLQGELAWVKGNHRSVLFEYSNAISCSADHGILMDQALANERLGRYMLERGDIERASLYFQEARATFQKWGANAKSDHLTKEMEKLNLTVKPVIFDDAIVE